MPQNSETSRPRLRRPAHPRFQCQTAEGLQPSAWVRILAAAMPELCKKMSLEDRGRREGRVPARTRGPRA
jgi:hypothetical protein